MPEQAPASGFDPLAAREAEVAALLRTHDEVGRVRPVVALVADDRRGVAREEGDAERLTQPLCDLLDLRAVAGDGEHAPAQRRADRTAVAGIPRPHVEAPVGADRHGLEERKILRGPLEHDRLLREGAALPACPGDDLVAARGVQRSVAVDHAEDRGARDARGLAVRDLPDASALAVLLLVTRRPHEDPAVRERDLRRRRDPPGNERDLAAGRPDGCRRPGGLARCGGREQGRAHRDRHARRARRLPDAVHVTSFRRDALSRRRSQQPGHATSGLALDPSPVPALILRSAGGGRPVCASSACQASRRRWIARVRLMMPPSARTRSTVTVRRLSGRCGSEHVHRQRLGAAVELADLALPARRLEAEDQVLAALHVEPTDPHDHRAVDANRALHGERRAAGDADDRRWRRRGASSRSRSSRASRRRSSCRRTGTSARAGGSTAR